MTSHGRRSSSRGGIVSLLLLMVALVALLSPVSTHAQAIAQRWNSENCTGEMEATNSEVGGTQCAPFSIDGDGDGSGHGGLRVLCDDDDWFVLTLFSAPDDQCAGTGAQLTGKGDGSTCVSGLGGSWRVTCRTPESSSVSLTVILVLAITGAVLLIVGAAIGYQCSRVKHEGLAGAEGERVADLEGAHGVVVGGDDGAPATTVVVSSPITGPTFKDPDFKEADSSLPLSSLLVPASPTVNKGPTPSPSTSGSAFNNRDQAPSLFLGASTLTPREGTASAHPSPRLEAHQLHPGYTPSASPLHAPTAAPAPAASSSSPAAAPVSDGISPPSRQRTREETWRIQSLDDNSGGPAFI